MHVKKLNCKIHTKVTASKLDGIVCSTVESKITGIGAPKKLQNVHYSFYAWGNYTVDLGNSTSVHVSINLFSHSKSSISFNNFSIYEHINLWLLENNKSTSH